MPRQQIFIKVVPTTIHTDQNITLPFIPTHLRVLSISAVDDAGLASDGIYQVTCPSLVPQGGFLGIAQAGFGTIYATPDSKIKLSSFSNGSTYRFQLNDISNTNAALPAGNYVLIVLEFSHESRDY